MNSRVSIVIPCFNHGRFLPEAIASVEQCDRDSYELIIVNDGSTDAETCKVIRDLQAAGYHVIDQPNLGLAAARNRGIRAAGGEYVLPLDADNLVRPQYIHSGIDVLDKDPDVAVVYGRAAYFGEETHLSFDFGGEFDLFRLLQQNYIDACAVLRRSAIEKCGGFDTEMPSQGFEDWDLWLSLTGRGYRFHFIDEVVFDYRIRNDSMIHKAFTNGEFSEVSRYLCKKHPLFALQTRIRTLESELAEWDRSRVMRIAKAYSGFRRSLSRGSTIAS